MDKRLLLLGGLGLGVYLLSRPGAGVGAGAGHDGGACEWVAPTGDVLRGVIVGGGAFCRINLNPPRDIPMDPSRGNGPRPV